MNSHSDLTRTWQAVSGLKGRTDKVERLAEGLRALDPREVGLGAAFLSGETGLSQPLGLGPASLRQAEVSPAPQASLSLTEVHVGLNEVARIQGSGSASRKLQGLQTLLARATASEQAFLFHLLSGELRQGALEGLVLEAVARATEQPLALLRRAWTLCGDLAEVTRAAFQEGTAGLTRFTLQPFRPLAPMLAQPAQDLEEALERLGEAALEFKLDGARIQVHKQQDRVSVYSRGLKEVTVAVPEVVEVVRALPASSLILDGEVLALRPDGRPHPFQTTMRRFGRRLEVESLRGTLPLTPFFFDCLARDGESLLDRPLSQRWEALEVVRDWRVPALRARTLEQATAFSNQALEAGHEGVMAKSLDSLYEAGGRGFHWLKLKPAHTLDLVVLAAEWGSGRRRGWLSNLHLGARAPEGFVMLGKTFKGLTDQTLEWQTRRLLELETRRDEWTVYVRPELVVEIALAEVQASPHYPAGLALRFARVRRYREDKAPTQADTLETVQELYERRRA